MQQHDCVQDPSRGVFALFAASGPPRLWHRTLHTAAAALSARVTKPTSATGIEYLRHLCQSVRNALRDESSVLLEHTPLDAGCALVMCERGTVHFVVTGSMRAYVATPRHAVPERLTPRDAKPDGVAAGELHGRSVSVQQTDLIVLGPDTTFSTTAIERFQNRFVQYRADPRVPSKRLLDAWVSELTTPHIADGTSAAAMLIAPT